MASLPEKSIALLAHSQRTRDMGPTRDPDWVIFGLNNIYRFTPPLHVAMQIHTPDYLAAHPAYSKEDLRWLETFQGPIVAQKRYPQWPASFPMPMGPKHRVNRDTLRNAPRYEPAASCPEGCDGKNIRHRFPRVPQTSTMGYMMELAIMWIEQGEFPGSLGEKCRPAARFGLWGFDTLDDYSTQGPQGAYLAAEADRAGIELVIPQASGFLREPFTYGYEAKKNALRRRQIDTRKAELMGAAQQLGAKAAQKQQELAQLQQRQLVYQAQLQENDYQRKNWTIDFDEDDPYAPGADGRVRSLNGNAPVVLDQMEPVELA